MSKPKKSKGRLWPSIILSPLILLIILLCQPVPFALAQDGADNGIPGQGVKRFQGSFNQTGNTTNLMDDYVIGVCAGGGAAYSPAGVGPDEVWVLQTLDSCGGDRVATVTVVPDTGFDPVLYVVADVNQISHSCRRVDDASPVDFAESISFIPQNGVDYYIVVDGAMGSSGAFTIDVACGAMDPTAVSFQSTTFSIFNIPLQFQLIGITLLILTLLSWIYVHLQSRRA